MDFCLGKLMYRWDFGNDAIIVGLSIYFISAELIREYK